MGATRPLVVSRAMRVAGASVLSELSSVVPSEELAAAVYTAMAALDSQRSGMLAQTPQTPPVA